MAIRLLPGGIPDPQNVSFVATPVANSTTNLAWVGSGAAQAIASSNPLAFPHSFAGINDGVYGNSSSYIPSVAPGSWIKIDLGATKLFNFLSLGRDRLGTFDDRDPGQFRIYAANQENVYASGNSSNDALEYSQIFDSAVYGFNGLINFTATLQARFEPIIARSVKIEFYSAGGNFFTNPAIDEVVINAGVNTGFNDIITVAAASDLVSGVVIDGGAGTDTLRLDVGGAVSLAGVTLTSIEAIALNNSGGTTLTVVDEAQANLVFSAAGAADTVSIMNFDFWGQGLAPLGTTLDHLFDAGVETIIWGEGGGDNTATRDAFGFVTVTGTDGSGQLWETSELVFNAAGERQSFHVDFDDGHTFHATFANDLPVLILIDYNPGGNPVANPGGVKLITQDFDAAGRLDTHETEYFNGSTWRYHYDDGGAVTHYDVDQVNPGGTYGWTINNQTFTPAGVLTSQHVVVNNGNVIDRSYSGGVITQEIVADGGAADPWTTITTDYVGGAFKQQTFVYDDGSAIAQGNAAANSITGRTGPGAGVDVLIGYGGSDTFVFTAGFGTDVIVDFTDGVDKIDLTAFGVTDLASLDAVGDVFTWNGGVAIDIGSNRIQLDGFTLANFGDQDLVG